ncbi:DUF6770 family protein [Lacibacter sediminis]|uniref:Uncharacterized protein n=1 Tax=Lacibacter sediminis TaxID=2760713 RepID=A0A7G5XF01_9BACT|nr:DUF6770 family protein [Lacibacter sediminis]QNA44054.1 hypothetical protein H4075_18555 [Lacibacter sediminis]
MKKLTVLFMLMSFFASTQAQKLSIANIQKSSVLRNSDAIKEGSEVKGYYFFYVSDKIDRNTNEYTLQIMDQSLNKLKEVKFQDSKNVIILESSFNGTDLVFLFYNSDDNILSYQVYGADGTKKYYYTKSITKKDEAFLAISLHMNDEDSNFKGLYPVEGKGFISNMPSRDNKDFTFQISYIGSDSKKQWSYVPAIDGKMFLGDYLGTFNNVVYIEMLKFSGMLDRNPDSFILGLSLENGKLLFQKSTNEGKYNFFPISMSVLNDGKAYVYGEYFNKGGNVMKDKSQGFAFIGIDDKGKTLTEKYSSWALDLGKQLGANGNGKIDNLGYMYLHSMVQADDGSIYAIGEGYKKAASALGITAQVLSGGRSGMSTVKLKVTDMVMIKFDKDFTVKEASIYEKNDNDILLGSGDEFVSTQMLGKQLKFSNAFDYAYTQVNKDHSSFSICYSDYERGKNYKGATFNSITYSDGKLTQDKIQTKSDATRSIVLPARQGQVLIMDYYKKDKKLDLHFEKLN